VRLRKIGYILAAVAFMSGSAAFAQSGSAPANPITASEKGFYKMVSGTVIAAAEKMPEENYSFKPTPDVRSFGQLVGHVADAQYGICSAAGSAPAEKKNIEKTKTSKADLVAALKEAVGHCETVFDGMTDAKGAEMVKMFGFNMAKLAVLSINTAHTDEHYGNMVTYLRIKGIVPPSSEKK
jgi:uncharacterized damage-inducible protein DinB